MAVGRRTVALAVVAGALAAGGGAALGASHGSAAPEKAKAPAGAPLQQQSSAPLGAARDDDCPLSGHVDASDL